MLADPLRPLCLFGAGGHGRVVRAQAKRFLHREALFGDGRATVPGLAIAFHDITAITGCDVVVTIGDNTTRRSLQELLSPDLVSPALVMEPDRVFASSIGPGSQILAGAIINPGAVIGKGVIVNSGAIVEHDCHVGDYCHVAPGSVVGGGARLGAGVLLGSNATVLPGVCVAEAAVIGAGAVVTSDITEAGTYVGVPARRLRGSSD
jgi:sugar O-acyltransferase (sialic acid O-acetyltransferase NeuD family)